MFFSAWLGAAVTAVAAHSVMSLFKEMWCLSGIHFVWRLDIEHLVLSCRRKALNEKHTILHVQFIVHIDMERGDGDWHIGGDALTVHSYWYNYISH